MAEASNERYALVEKAQKFGRDIEHKYVMRTATETILDRYIILPVPFVVRLGAGES